MPAPELAYRLQKALLWRATGHDAYGQFTVSPDSVELIIRWVSGRTEVLGPEGNPIAVDATVVVDREIEIGSIMWSGSHENLWDLLPGTGTGTGSGYVPVADLMEVISYNETPDLKNRYKRRTVGLKFYRDSMPGFAS